MYLFQDFKHINKLTLLFYLIIGTRERAVFIFRLSSWCQSHKLKILAKFFWSLNVTLHSCDISPYAKIGSGFKMFHTVGIVVGAVNAGDNLHLFQNTTIGDKHHILPRFGNNVTLYAGAVVVGNIKIGDNVLIGANSVVLNDISSNSTAVGSPARVTKSYNSTKHQSHQNS